MLVFFGIIYAVVGAISKADKKNNRSSRSRDRGDVEAPRRTSQPTSRSTGTPTERRETSSSSGGFLGQLKKEFQEAYEQEKGSQSGQSNRNAGAGQRQRTNNDSNGQKQAETKRRLEEQRRNRERRNERSRDSNRGNEEKRSRKDTLQDQTRGARAASIEERRASNRLDRFGRPKNASKPALQNVVSLEGAKRKKKKASVSFGKKQMVNAVIYKEILDKPLATREEEM